MSIFLCTYTYIYIHNIYIYNVKSGLINPSRLINHHCPFFCHLKTGGPPRLINTLAYPRLIKHQCWNSFFLIYVFLFPMLFLSHHSSSAEITFVWTKMSYVQFNLFLIMSHQSQNHEILAIKSNLIKSNRIVWNPWYFSNQISSNPMESYGNHEILAIKSHQPQWNLMGSMEFQQSHLINHHWILWGPMAFSNKSHQTQWNLTGIHEILATKSPQTQWNVMGPMEF